MKNNQLVQKDYSKYPRNYQLKISSELDIMIPCDESVRLLSEVMEDLDYTGLYRAYSPQGRKPKPFTGHNPQKNAGVGNGLFDGDREITRAELVTMLYRYAQCAGLETGTGADLSEWPDGSDIPDWAAEAFAWAVGVGIVSGTDAGELLPAKPATRAQVSSIFMRLITYMGS